MGSAPGFLILWSVGYCGGMPLNKDEAILIEVARVIKMMFKFVHFMNKLIFSFVALVQIVSSLLAQDCNRIYF